jgi:ribosome biogenesis protein ENP2
MATPVYNLAKGKTLPEFIEESRTKRQSLRYNEDFRRRMELLHDMQFKGNSSCVTISEDHNYIAASGAYPPEVRIFDLSDLGMKCVRRLDHEIIQTEFLSEDYRKLAMLCADRTIEFHAQYGKHHIVRIPKFGRSMKYDRATCILYAASSSEAIYRVDLEEGVFLAPLVSNLADEKITHTSMAMAPSGLPLVLGGLDNGVVQCWDTRDDSKPTSSLVASVDGNEVRQIAWSKDAMQIACGLDNGVVKGYDIRSNRRALFEKDHRNDFPVVGLHYVSKSVIASADERSVKIWDVSGSEDNHLVGFVESRDKIRGLTFWPDSGLFFTPCDAPRVGTYFAPGVGPAPKWCAFLDTVADELNQLSTGKAIDGTEVKHVYEDHIFLTREQLQALGAEKLIGTPVVKAYMHGFWMDRKVHAKLRDVAEPFRFEQFQQKRIQEELDKQRPMRMPVRVKTETKGEVNQRLQRELSEKISQIENKKENVIATKILEDSRFSKLWSNKDFEVEEVRKTQEDDAFNQVGVREVEHIDLKAVNRMHSGKKKKTRRL